MEALVRRVPGTPGGIHRIGGLEREDITGNISYDPDNHQRMTEFRAQKVRGIAKDMPAQEVALGKSAGRLAVVGWGSTYGPINRAVDALIADGLDANHIHIRHLWPLPENLGDLIAGFDKLLVLGRVRERIGKLLHSGHTWHVA